MSTYTDRMKQVRDERNNAVVQSFVPPNIRRPLSSNAPVTASGKSPVDQNLEDQIYKDTDFYRHLQYHTTNTRGFGDVYNQLVTLASGLRHEVEQGYTPHVIAEQRLKQFVDDAAMGAKDYHEQGGADKEQQGDYLNQMIMGLAQHADQMPTDQGQPQPTEQGQAAPQEVTNG